MSFCFIVPRRSISCSSVLYRYATVTKDGSYNKEKETSDKKSAWNYVKPAGVEDVIKERRKFRMNEEMISDPHEAEQTSLKLFNRLAQSLKDKGYSREVRPYVPREDVIECIKNIYSSIFAVDEKNVDEWLNQPLDDMFVKFKFLSECDKQFEHEVPSPDLHLMKTVGDVVDFYQTPMRGLTTYDDLARRQNELPPNLHVINQYIRFNPETDTFFGGKDAFPNTPMVVQGIRGRQKYEDVKVPFEWPDV